MKKQASAGLSVRARVLGGLAVTLVFFSALEVVLRFVLGPPPPPVEVFTVLDQTDHYLKAADGRVYTTYQQVAPIDSFAIAPQGVRLFFLGGSSVHFGKGTMEASAEFPSLLGATFKVESINLGSPGLDSFDLVRLTEDALTFGPDALVIYAGHNDLGNAYFQKRYGDAVGGVSARLLPWLELSQIFVQMRRGLSGPDGEQRIKGPSVNVGNALAKHASLAPQRRAAAARYYKANLERIAWACSQAGVPLILVVPMSNLHERPVGRPACEEPPCTLDLFDNAQRLGLSDPGAVASMLRESRDVDPLGIRATTSFQNVVRGFEGRPGVWVVDAPRDVEQDRELPLPDRTLFDDLIHPSHRGHIELARVISPALLDVLGFEAVNAPAP